jgi:uncharacterized protein YlxP (DUF503 family)
LRSLKDRISNTHNVSVAEVGQQDKWQFAELAFVTVAAQNDVVQKRISSIQTALQSDPRYVLMNMHTEFL